MKARTGFFQDSKGNNSSSRLLGFITVLVSLALSIIVLVFGFMEGTHVIVSAASAGTIFTTIAGPVMLYMYHQKKKETISNDSLP